MNPRYGTVADRALHRCEYCRAPEFLFNLPFEVEHVIPVSQGGQDDDSNLALACRSCNVHKGWSTTGVDPATGEVVRLFNPRVDRWSEHFCAEGATRRIDGISPVGRATVDRLRLNGGSQLLARKEWIRLGAYP